MSLKNDFLTIFFKDVCKNRFLPNIVFVLSFYFLCGLLPSWFSLHDLFLFTYFMVEFVRVISLPFFKERNGVRIVLGFFSTLLFPVDGVI